MGRAPTAAPAAAAFCSAPSALGPCLPAGLCRQACRHCPAVRCPLRRAEASCRLAAHARTFCPCDLNSNRISGVVPLRAGWRRWSRSWTSQRLGPGLARWGRRRGACTAGSTAWRRCTRSCPLSRQGRMPYAGAIGTLCPHCYGVMLGNTSQHALPCILCRRHAFDCPSWLPLPCVINPARCSTTRLPTNVKLLLYAYCCRC